MSFENEMRKIDRENAAMTIISGCIIIGAVLYLMFLCMGCAVVKGRAGDSRYIGWAWGEKASSALAGLVLTEECRDPEKNTITERTLGVDSAGSETQTEISKILGTLILQGLRGVHIVPVEDKEEDE